MHGFIIYFLNITKRNVTISNIKIKEGDTMEHIILALLYLKSRTIYEIRTKFEGNLGLMYSSSMGSIQAAVKKLLKAGCISYTELVENGKYKKQYSITEAGRERVCQWVNSPFGAAQNKNPELAKLYFMGLSNKENRCSRIREHIASLQEYHSTLELLYEEGRVLNPPEEYGELFPFQLVTIKFGVDSSAFAIEWLSGLAADMEQGKI